jgi:hypothetical protein
VSKPGPLQAPGHDQKKAGACAIVRALIQAFFVGSEGGVEIGEENPLRGSACPYCLRKTTDDDNDNEVTVNFWHWGGVACYSDTPSRKEAGQLVLL